jgi:TonB family protein
MFKFKKKISQVLKDNPELKRQGLCLLSSVIIHAIFIFLCFIFIKPIKVYIYENKITDILIVPPEKLFIPETNIHPTAIGVFSKNPPGTGPEKKSGLPREEGRFQVGADSNITETDKDRLEERTEKMTSHPELSSGFSLDIPSSGRNRSDRPTDKRLVLPLSPEKKGNILKEITKGYEKKDLDFLRYMYSDYAKTGQSKGTYHSRSSARRASTPRGSATFEAKSYDITPWAKIVVEKIQRNWVLDPSQTTRAKGEVEIFVRIEKSGEISTVEVVRSSEIQLLDQAALKALRMSSPLPKLPDDFPEKSLEAYFVFGYDD